MTKKKDELGSLIIASNNTPLPWMQQERLVELFILEIIENEVRHKKHVDELLEIIKTQHTQYDLLFNQFKGCDGHVNSFRRGRQNRKINASRRTKKKS